MREYQRQQHVLTKLLTKNLTETVENDENREAGKNTQRELQKYATLLQLTAGKQEKLNRYF